eukprot:g3086.t1
MEFSSKKRRKCEFCTNPVNSCLCIALPKQKLKLSFNVIILQHPKEAKKKSLNTVLLLKLCIENCYVYVDNNFAHGRYPLLDEALDGKASLVNYILYPGHNSQPINEIFDVVKKRCQPLDRDKKKDNPMPTLIAIDGTWKQAKNITRSNPRLLKRCDSDLEQLVRGTSVDAARSNLLIQTMLVDDVNEDEYLRTEPRTHYMATAIAVGRALNIIDPKYGAICLRNIRNAFDHMQDITRKYQGTPKKQFRFQSHTDFEDISLQHMAIEIIRKLQEKHIDETKSLADLKGNNDGLHTNPSDANNLLHDIIFAYPVHQKDSSVIFRRFPCDALRTTIRQGKEIVAQINVELKRVRGQRLTIYTLEAWDKYLSSIMTKRA